MNCPKTIILVTCFALVNISSVHAESVPYYSIEKMSDMAELIIEGEHIGQDLVRITKFHKKPKGIPDTVKTIKVAYLDDHDKIFCRNWYDNSGVLKKRGDQIKTKRLVLFLNSKRSDQLHDVFKPANEDAWHAIFTINIKDDYCASFGLIWVDDTTCYGYREWLNPDMCLSKGKEGHDGIPANIELLRSQIGVGLKNSAQWRAALAIKEPKERVWALSRYLLKSTVPIIYERSFAWEIRTQKYLNDHPEYAVPILVELLKNVKPDDNLIYVILILRDIGPRASPAVPLLCKLLESHEQVDRSKPGEIQYTLDALQSIGDCRAILYVKLLLKNKTKWVAKKAAETLDILYLEDPYGACVKLVPGSSDKSAAIQDTSKSPIRIDVELAYRSWPFDLEIMPCMVHVSITNVSDDSMLMINHLSIGYRDSDDREIFMEVFKKGTGEIVSEESEDYENGLVPVYTTLKPGEVRVDSFDFCDSYGFPPQLEDGDYEMVVYYQADEHYAGELPKGVLRGIYASKRIPFKIIKESGVRKSKQSTFIGRLIEIPPPSMRCGDMAIAAVFKFKMIEVLSGRYYQDNLLLIILCPEFYGDSFFKKDANYQIEATSDMGKARAYAVENSYKNEGLSMLWVHRIEEFPESTKTDSIHLQYLHLLGSEHGDWRNAADWFISEGRIYVPILIRSLKDTNTVYLQKARIIITLGELKDTRAVEPLSGYLEAGQFIWESAHALGLIGGDKAVQALLKAMDNETPDVVKDAVKAIGLTGHPKAVEPLKVKLLDTDASVRYYAVKSLVAIGPDGLAKILKNHLQTESDLYVQNEINEYFMNKSE